MESLRKWQKKGSKVHDLTQDDWDHSFSYDPTGREGEIYLTSQGRNVQPGDCIVIGNPSGYIDYQVREIEYYAEPPDMWIALLVKATT